MKIADCSVSMRLEIKVKLLNIRIFNQVERRGIVMLLIQTTKKLTEQLNKKYSKENIIENASIFSWHAHVFFYKRRKYVIVMNNRSRYNFILGSMVKKDFMKFDERVKEGIKDNLLADEFSPEIVEKYLDQCETIHFAPTSDRSIISQMNEMISATKHMWNVDDIEVQGVELFERNRRNNEFVMLTLPETYSKDAMESALREIEE